MRTRGIARLGVQQTGVGACATVALLVVSAALSIFGVNSHDDELRVFNITPYDIRFAVHHPEGDNKAVTFGWINLAPGETWATKIDFGKTPPRFFIFGETISPTPVKMVHPEADNSSTLYFTGSDLVRSVPTDGSNFRDQETQSRETAPRSEHGRAPSGFVETTQVEGERCSVSPQVRLLGS